MASEASVKIPLYKQQSSHWQITYYPPEELQSSKEECEEDAKLFVAKKLPPGWSFGTANLEKCPNTGSYHWQGFLKTTYCRGTDVKRVIGDRAHIEKSRKPIAVVQYSNKEETRVATIEAPRGVPTPWEYIDIVAKFWDQDEFSEYCSGKSRSDERMDEFALEYVDRLVAKDIENGATGVEFIAVNPMFRSAWKKFWRSIIKRNASHQASSSSPAPPPPAEEACSDCEESEGEY